MPTTGILAANRPPWNLIGMHTKGGWEITEQLQRAGSVGAKDLTGSCFSIGYIAKKKENKKEKEAFLKVLDLESLLIRAPEGQLMDKIAEMGQSHQFECEILQICSGLDRIIKILEHGELPPPPGMPFRIPYILLELAQGDARKFVYKSNKIDDAWRLKVLHNITVGLQQLHGKQIAHQDLKPSNVLIFDGPIESKIGDLGRASIQGGEARHDNYSIAGDPNYAPPEQVFGIVPEDWVDRRESCDLYHLGTLTTFLFSGLTPTEYYLLELPKDISPIAWGGKVGMSKTGYENALPALMITFTNFVDIIKTEFPLWAREELAQIIINTCNPDYRKRGDPSARKRHQIGIETFVSRFDRLSKRAKVELKNESLIQQV